MGLYQGEHCKGCGCVLKGAEIAKGWDVCFECGYQINGDSDNMPPPYEPHGGENTDDK